MLLCVKIYPMVRYVLIAINVILLMAIAINALLKDFFSNTFEVGKLLTLLALVGVLTAIPIAILSIRKSAVSSGIARLQITLISVIMSVFFFVVAGVNLNYLLAKKPEVSKKYLTLDIRPFFKSGGGILKGEKIVPNGYVVYVEKEGNTVEIRYKTLENYESLVGKTVALDIRKGLLGFEVFVPSPIAEN